ncbi:hypothetical protein BEH_09155 [Priestia filamentosa]|uniref:Uncharacterized protein n=1 Tax=Priestia filamentosa TaxID=1402861 RepID=A0A0H4KHH0_9BACI|nr:hypothetical protein BEH_09155 [Priestia filamentosa]OXS68842.1 hypothetical protein B1B01_07565 [Priestia filamentosa]
MDFKKEKIAKSVVKVIVVGIKRYIHLYLIYGKFYLTDFFFIKIAELAKLLSNDVRTKTEKEEEQP